MSANNTNGYEVAFVVRDAELGRMVQTAFLERRPAQGLPLEFEQELPFEIPDGTGGSVPSEGMFIARFDLPIITFDPFRDVIDTFQPQFPEHPANSLEVRLQFQESALLPDVTAPMLGLFNLNGDLSLIIPIGHPENENGERNFGLDIGNLSVWIRLADDDPDPDSGNRTTRDKVVDAFALLGITWGAVAQLDLEDRLATALQASVLVRQLGNVGLNLTGAACPIAPLALPPPQVLRVDPPTDINCIDFETFHPDVNGPSFLALKLKMTAQQAAAGTNTPNALGRTWMGGSDRASVLISDDFLLRNVLSPGMIQALLVDEFERRDDEEQIDVAAEFFSAPLNIVQPIPMRLPLPLVDEDDETPNTFVDGVSLAIVPDPDNAPNNMVQVSLVLSGGVSWYYTFDATVRVNVRFDAGSGRLDVEMETSSNNQIDVHPHPLAYIIPAGLGVLLLGVLGPFFGGLFVVGYIVPTLTIVFLADVVADIVAYLFVPGAVNSELAAETPDTDALTDVAPLLLRSAEFDDLVLKGELVPAENRAVSYVGFTPPNRATWRLDLERNRFDLRRLVADDPLLRDAFTDVDAGAASVICENVSVRPANGARLHDFGTIDLWRALNLVQADLRNVDYTITNARIISLPPDALVDLTLPSRLALISPLDFGPSLGLPVRAFGVQTALGRFALLVVWIAGNNRCRCFYRRYNQALPGVAIVPNFPLRPVGDFSDCTRSREHTTTRVVPGGLGDFMFPTPDRGLESGDGGVSVQVGYREYECITRGTFEARPILLRQPLELAWTVATRDGVRHTLVPGQPNVIDVSVQRSDSGIVIDLAHNPLIDRPRGSRVTFTLSGRNNRICSIETQRGRAGSFVIEAEYVEVGTNTFTTELEFGFVGKRIESVGFGALRRVLDQLHRGVQDPSTWPDLGVTLPGGREPGPKPPDPRDSPPGGGRPGVRDPSRPGMPERESGDGSPTPRRHYFARSTGSDQREMAGSAPDQKLSKEDLLHNTLQTFRDMPDDLFNHPQVKQYMASVVKLIASLPDPPGADAKDDDNDAPTPSIEK